MPSMIRNTYTAVIARGDLWEQSVQTEPYEAAWAAEAVFFVRVLEVVGPGKSAAVARVQISPDGLHWVDEGAQLQIDARPESLCFARISNFGGWLRLDVTVPPESGIKVVATLALKA
ncbi:MAG: hypothetical protein ABI343_14240 [Burkholderiaceae bacterium]